ncbi:MAG: Uma2 family endonuclease [Planctomycetes bacterium]|nr:Uma2 family endonuclease [Planctomycetota bacterium]
MAVLVIDPLVEDDLLARRRASGGDRYDEVWDGVYLMSPIPNSEHQQLAGRLTGVFLQVVGWNPRVEVFPGINVSDREDDWTQNYRVPDVAVFLENTRATDLGTHWLGGPDFGVEIESPKDRSREKIPFYAQVGVQELLLIERDPWALELYRLQGNALVLVGRVVPGDEAALESAVLHVRFRLIPATPRPLIEVTRLDGSERWLV